MTDKAYRFVVVGAGGIGSHLCSALAMMLEYKAPNSALLIVDGDTFEPKNKERQLFKHMGNKAESVAADLAPQYPNTAIVPIGKWVVAEAGDKKEDDAKGVIAVERLLNEGDVIFPVVDNFAARGIVFDQAGKLDNCNVISAGNDDALFASLYHYIRSDGKDVTLHPRAIHPEYIDPPDRNPGELSCQERAAIDGGTQLVAANLAAVTLILGKVQTAIFEQRPRFNQADIAEGMENSDEIFIDLSVGLAQASDRTAIPQVAPAAAEVLTTTGAT